MLNIDNHVKQLIKEEVAKAMEKVVKTVPEERQLYTQKEACEFLKISRPTILKLRKEGKLNYYTAGSGIRYKRSDLLNIKSN